MGEKLVGSRFFFSGAAAGGGGLGESMIGEGGGEGKKVRVEISDGSCFLFFFYLDGGWRLMAFLFLVAVDLFVPMKGGKGERHLVCGVRDLEVGLVLPGGGGKVRREKKGESERELVTNVPFPLQEQLQLNLLLLDILIRDLTHPLTIFSRTLPRNLATGSVPILRLGFNSSVDEETGVKESRVKVDLSGFTVGFDGDVEWIGELGEFVKSPEGVCGFLLLSSLTIGC